MIRCLIVSLILCVGCASPRPNLPMPGDSPEWKAVRNHFETCKVCSVEDPDGGPGAICDLGYELLVLAMESESTWWRMSPRDGYHYRGPKIDGWEWNVQKQKWEAV
jgi:hypothetical protein